MADQGDGAIGAASHPGTVRTFEKSEKTAAIREENTKAAIAADAIGSPCYVYKGEPFWGQDRLDLLDHMITTGREPVGAL